MLEERGRKQFKRSQVQQQQRRGTGILEGAVLCEGSAIPGDINVEEGI